MRACLLVVLLVFAASCQAAHFHALIVVDTFAEGLQVSVAADLKKAESQTQKIAYYTGLGLKQTILEGETLSAKNVLKKLKKLKTSKNDVILFYFAGHGHRSESKHWNPWPNIEMEWGTTEIDLGDIVEILEQKKARLVLVLADCCNDPLPMRFKGGVNGIARGCFSKSSQVRKNYCDLFLKTSGILVASGAQPGQGAWGTHEGGLFSSALWESLLQEVSFSDKPSWDNILEYTTILLADDEQFPEYEIRLVSCL